MRYCKIPVFKKILIKLAAVVPVHRYAYIMLSRAVSYLRYLMFTPYLSDLQYTILYTLDYTSFCVYHLSLIL